MGERERERVMEENKGKKGKQQRRGKRIETTQSSPKRRG